MSTRPRRSSSRKSPLSRLDEASAKAKTAARQHAAGVAKLINGHTEAYNMDLSCTVAGITHRGGFKLNFAPKRTNTHEHTLGCMINSNHDSDLRGK